MACKITVFFLIRALFSKLFDGSAENQQTIRGGVLKGFASRSAVPLRPSAFPACAARGRGCAGEGGSP